MSDNRTVELKPCPFCGAEPEIIEDRVTMWALIEHRDGCLFPTFPKHEIRPYDWEAWNTRTPEQDVAATLGAPTCEYVIEDNMNETEGMGDVWFRCTNCDTCYDYQADDWLLKMPHCPKCGATVKAVK